MRGLLVMSAIAACGRAPERTALDEAELVRDDAALQRALASHDDVGARAAEDDLRATTDRLRVLGHQGSTARRVDHVRSALDRLERFEDDARTTPRAGGLRAVVAAEIHAELSPLIDGAAGIARAHDDAVRAFARDVGAFCTCSLRCVDAARVASTDWQTYEDELDEEHDPLVGGLLLVENRCARELAGAH